MNGSSTDASKQAAFKFGKTGTGVGVYCYDRLLGYIDVELPFFECDSKNPGYIGSWNAVVTRDPSAVEDEVKVGLQIAGIPTLPGKQEYIPYLRAVAEAFNIEVLATSPYGRVENKVPTDVCIDHSPAIMCIFI